MDTKYGASWMLGALNERFGNGVKAEKRKVDYLTKLAHAYGAKRLDSKAYSECEA